MAPIKVSTAAMRTGLGRVRGLGSAKDGVAHWWAQRVYAVALVPLTLWFVFSVVGLAGASQAQVQAWMASPLNTALLVLLVFTTFHHLLLGLQTVIEDYMRAEGWKLVLQMSMRFIAVLFGMAGILAVLRVAL
jgi:succinate dehydrogenase / fumarate reductase membrane anchor subunit